MIDDSPANVAIQDQAREEKPVTTNVYETLEYALDIFGKAEDLQYQKNVTNRHASGLVMWKGETLFELPIDEMLGLEARLTKLRLLIAEVPTLDASKHWAPATDISAHVWQTVYPEETTKTEKKVVPIIMKDATKEHPAQVQAIQRDDVVGKFTTIKRSGSATALQKAEALKRIDELLVEIKQARTRANETLVTAGKISDRLLPLLLEPFASSKEDHQ